MNLRLIIPILKSALDNLDFESAYNTSGTGYSASGLINLRNTINSLKGINFLEPYLTEIFKTSLFDSYKDAENLTSQDNSTLKSVLNQIKNGIAMILLYYNENYSIGNSDEKLLIELPEFKTFDDLSPPYWRKYAGLAMSAVYLCHIIITKAQVRQRT